MFDLCLRYECKTGYGCELSESSLEYKVMGETKTEGKENEDPTW